MRWQKNQAQNFDFLIKVTVSTIIYHSQLTKNLSILTREQ